ncbi:hypothetical protein BGZ73_006083 [Actinomortierella ambigua]|nr:hypothetical protein BGZ73_006083 [Actinomortierella ambigua]
MLAQIPSTARAIRIPLRPNAKELATHTWRSSQTRLLVTCRENHHHHHHHHHHVLRLTDTNSRASGVPPCLVRAPLSRMPQPATTPFLVRSFTIPAAVNNGHRSADRDIGWVSPSRTPPSAATNTNTIPPATSNTNTNTGTSTSAGTSKIKVKKQRAVRIDLSLDEYLRLGQLVRELDPRHFPGRTYRAIAERVHTLRKQAAAAAVVVASEEGKRGRKARSSLVVEEEDGKLDKEDKGQEEEEEVERRLKPLGFYAALERAVLQHGPLAWTAVRHDLQDAERIYQQTVATMIRQAEHAAAQKVAAEAEAEEDDDDNNLGQESSHQPSTTKQKGKAGRANDQVERLKKKFVFFPDQRGWVRDLWNQYERGGMKEGDVALPWSLSETDALKKLVHQEQKQRKKQQKQHPATSAKAEEGGEDLSAEAWIDIGKKLPGRSPFECQTQWRTLEQQGTDNELYDEILEAVWDVQSYKGQRLDQIVQLDTDKRGQPVATKLLAPALDTPPATSATTTTQTTATPPRPPRASKLLGAVLSTVQGRLASEAQWDEEGGFDPHTDNWTHHEVGLLLQANERYGTHYTVFARVAELLGMDPIRVISQWLMCNQDKNEELPESERGQKKQASRKDGDGSAGCVKATPEGAEKKTVQGWTKEMDEVLLEAVKNRGPDEPMASVFRRVASQFGRTNYSVAGRYRRLKDIVV